MHPIVAAIFAIRELTFPLEIAEVSLYLFAIVLDHPLPVFLDSSMFELFTNASLYKVVLEYSPFRNYDITKSDMVIDTMRMNKRIKFG